jgi:3-oxoacid CoA-transferase
MLPFNSATELATGFGLGGTPDTLINALAKRKDVNNLTAVSNNCGLGELGLGISPVVST